VVLGHCGKMEENTPGIEIIKILVKHKRPIAIAVGFAALCSIIITTPIIIPPQYLAETTIYPPGSYTSSGLLNSDMRFGSETDIDDEIQILHSTILRDSIVNKYHLYSHYKIDTQSAKKTYYVNKIYNENVQFSQSRYNSIEIDVYDEDPAIAAAIANDIVKMGDEVKTGIVKKNLKIAFELASRQLTEKTKEIADLGDSIIYLKHKNYDDAINLQKSHYLAEKGNVDDLRNSIVNIRNEDSIYDFETQFNSIYGAYLKADAEYLSDSGMVKVMRNNFKSGDSVLVRKEAEFQGARILTRQLANKLAKLNRSDKKYNALFDSYKFEKEILSGLKTEYETSTSTFEKEFDNLKLETLKGRYTSEMQLYNVFKTKYELALSNVTDQVPASYIVSPAEIPVIKAYPKRLLIIGLVTLGAFLLSILFFTIYGNIHHIRELIKDKD